MPKSKAFISDSDSDSASDKDSEPKAKKSKKEKKSPEKGAAKKEKSGEISFQLSKMRYVSVTEFRGKPLISIREFYENDGELKPGRKGISLTKDQWQKLKSHMDEIDEALKDY